MPTRSRHDQIDQLYRTHASTLEHLVQTRVIADPDTVQDACSFAWTQLLISPNVELAPRAPLGWLRQVATRHVWQLTAAPSPLREHDARDIANLLLTGERDLADRVCDRLLLADRVSNLSARQRKYLFLHACGYRYSEIAALMGVTYRTVDRQLARARAHLRQST